MSSQDPSVPSLDDLVDSRNRAYRASLILNGIPPNGKHAPISISMPHFPPPWKVQVKRKSSGKILHRFMHPKNGLWTDMVAATQFRRWLEEEEPDRDVSDTEDRDTEDPDEEEEGEGEEEEQQQQQQQQVDEEKSSEEEEEEGEGVDEEEEEEEEESQPIITTTTTTSPSQKRKKRKAASIRMPPKQRSQALQKSPPSSSSPPPSPSTWLCPTCSLYNSSTSLTCQSCSSPHTPSICLLESLNLAIWLCNSCNLVNSTGTNICACCEVPCFEFSTVPKRKLEYYDAPVWRRYDKSRQWGTVEGLKEYLRACGGTGEECEGWRVEKEENNGRKVYVGGGKRFGTLPQVAEYFDLIGCLRNRVKVD
ncbi:hypothetical protein TrVE_jg4039 [Triparma verrucosa]|uniref:RanBP2-type domain-containing protein n=1 Tax=Triparma verrucosa TaxID=1606542 RepID=A0A9W7EYM3_9STRA|nr:hypothetical protein TrVE_jg4039 [Triparma verrucosa]